MKPRMYRCRLVRRVGISLQFITYIGPLYAWSADWSLTYRRPLTRPTPWAQRIKP